MARAGKGLAEPADKQQQALRQVSEARYHRLPAGKAAQTLLQKDREPELLPATAEMSHATGHIFK